MVKPKQKLKNIIKLGVFLTLSIFAFLSYTYFSQAQVPDFVNYQGRLRDNAGNPITTPTAIQFSLYNHITNGSPTDSPSSAGALLWTETYDGSSADCQEITPGTDGIFAQHLGDCVPFPDYLDFTQEYYLGVKIGADAEATPRVPLATNPYAFTAKRLYVEGDNVYINTATSGDIVLQAAEDILLYDTNASVGIAGQILSATGDGVEWINGSALSAGSLWDADSDTGIQVEETADDDIIRFDTLGSQRMAIDGGGNVIFSDTEPASLVNPGALQGLLFRDDKFALRIGEASGTQWDDVNIGNGSFASGEDNIVSGNYSSAFGGDNNINDVYSAAFGRYNDVTSSYAIAGGYDNTASGYASSVFGQTNQVTDVRAMAWGMDNIASADESTAWGLNTRASGSYATSWGRDTQANGAYATAWGYNNDATADFSTAWGQDNTASGNYSTVFGNTNTASGQYATAWGNRNTASGTNSTAFGYYSTASGRNAVAMGDTVANSYFMTSVGRFNVEDSGQDATNWVDSDYLFVVGNGSGWASGDRNNALTILKDGSFQIDAPIDSAVLTQQPTGGVDLAIATIKYVDDSIVSSTNWTQVVDGGVNYLKPITTHNAITFGTGNDKGWVSGDNGMLRMGADVIDMEGISGLLFSSPQIDMKGYLRIDTLDNGNGAAIYTNNLTAGYDYEFPDYAGDFVITNNSIASNGDLLTWNGTQWAVTDPASYSNNIYTGNGSLLSDRVVSATANNLTFDFDDEGEILLRSTDDGSQTGEMFTNFEESYLSHVTAGTDADIFSVGEGTAYMRHTDLTTNNFNGINLSPTGIIVIDDILKKGASYDEDYSANYTNRSLVDKEYVDGVVAGGSLWTKTGTSLSPATSGDDVLLNDNEDFLLNHTGGSFSVDQGFEVALNDNSIQAFDITNQNSGNAATAEVRLFNDGGQVGTLAAMSSGYSLISGAADTFSVLGVGHDVMFGSLNSGDVSIGRVDGFSNQIYRDIFIPYATGMVGIGTTSPLSILHVNNNDSNTVPIFTMENNAGDIQLFRTDSTPEGLVVGSVGDLSFDGTNGELYVKNSGDATGNGWLRLLREGDLASLWDTDGDTGIQIEESADEDIIRFDTAGGERMIIDQNGNVGIGTASPAGVLAINTGTYEAVFTEDGFGNKMTLGDSFYLSGRNVDNYSAMKVYQGLQIYDQNETNKATIGPRYLSLGWGKMVVDDASRETTYESYRSHYFTDVEGGGTTLMAIIGGNSSRQGNVGIGDVNPDVRLVVNSQEDNDIPILSLANTAGDVQLFRTDVNPENSVVGSVGDLAIDGTNGELYIKNSGDVTNTGWISLGSGGVSPAGNDGAIQYNNGGSFGGDEVNFFWDDTNNRLGLGTNIPDTQLTLVGDGSAGSEGSIKLATYADSGYPSGLYFSRSRGTEAAPTAITNGLPLGGVVVGGYDGSSMVSYAGGLQMESTEDWSSGGHGNKLFFSTTENGSTGMSQRMVIMDNGDIGIGTSTPTQKLDVVGNIQTNSAIIARGGSNGGEDAHLIVDSGASTLHRLIQAENDNGVQFVVNSNNGIGIVGVGVTNPQAALHVRGNDGRVLGLDDGNGGFSTIYETQSNPEGNITAYRGDLAIDGVSGNIYIKNADDNADTGWVRLLEEGDLVSIWDTDDDTGIQVEANVDEDMIRFNTAGNQRMLIKDSGLLTLGTELSDFSVAVFGTSHAKVNINQDDTDMAGVNVMHIGDDNYPARVSFAKARGSEGNEVLVQDGDEIGEITSIAYDGSQYITAGGLSIRVDGTTGANTIPTSLAFLTTNSGDLGSSEKMILNSQGNLGIGVLDPAYRLTVAGGAIMLDDSPIPTASQGYAGIYSSGGELFAFDESGNSTQLSPHDANGEWWYNSTNVNTGKILQIKMESLTKELNKLLGGGYITENGEMIDKGINIIDELSLKTDENVETIKELQASVDDNLTIINQTLITIGEKQNSFDDSLNSINENIQEIEDIKESLVTLSENVVSLSELNTTLTDTVADHEVRIAELEDILISQGISLDDDMEINTSNVELDNISDSLEKFANNLQIIKDESGELRFTLEGDLEVRNLKAIEVEAESVSVGDVKAENVEMDKLLATSDDVAGEAVIEKGDDSVRVKFKNKYEDKPYVTAVVNNEFVLYKVSNVSEDGFEIIISEEATKDIKFTWQAIGRRE